MWAAQAGLASLKPPRSAKPSVRAAMVPMTTVLNASIAMPIQPGASLLVPAVKAASGNVKAQEPKQNPPAPRNCSASRRHAEVNDE